MVCAREKGVLDLGKRKDIESIDAINKETKKQKAKNEDVVSEKKSQKKKTTKTAVKKKQSKVPKIDHAAKKRETIETDLIEQLIKQNKSQEFYLDLVNDYMFYYGLKMQMQKDISNRGLVITVTTGNGFTKKSVNENVKELRETSKMMLKIIQDLGLQEPKGDEENPDDEALY